ncbi:Short-chain dehydrogenase/reductase family protein [Mycena venus]|uniref:Short-chain dehydrogenase/reductase family protein n=1 Tax=Mycena venus TaxID=2733690 RepID=A0A8H6WRI2_9AGAR|nr:Short-chain dehydrogenase/reductase family protein [Mycena venus]
MSTTRSILVTGSNQGLGMHTVHQLAATPNVLVFMGSRQISAAEEALARFQSDVHPTSAVVPVQLDITDETSISLTFDFIGSYLKTKTLEGLDVLINNAAIDNPTFHETFQVNLFGTVAVTEAFRPLLNNGGAILNISSFAGSISLFTKQPAPRIHLAYVTSKAALNRLTAHLAADEMQKGSGIQVVSICPGYNATGMNAYSGTMAPSEGCKVIVTAALNKELKSGTFFNKDGDLEW